MFVHGFTGHPKDTWTIKVKEQSKNRAKRHGQDDEIGDVARPSKRPKLPFFGRRPSTLHSTVTSAPASPGPSRTPTADGTNGRDQAGSEGQRLKEVYWPADLARQTIPNSRILTYGYDTKVRHWLKGQVSKKTVYDHAWDMLCSLEAFRRHPNEERRPIVFIAHSLGGIVVKEALRRARACESSKPHIHNVLSATSSIVFFGTPHGGADPRNSLHHILSLSAQALGMQTNKQIVSTLMPDSERLAELRDEFPVLCQERKWLIYSFQEEYGVTYALSCDSDCLPLADICEGLCSGQRSSRTAPHVSTTLHSRRGSSSPATTWTCAASPGSKTQNTSRLQPPWGTSWGRLKRDPKIRLVLQTRNTSLVSSLSSKTNTFPRRKKLDTRAGRPPSPSPRR